MHKNRQITVDFMSNIRLHVGMDARQMNKYILLAALQRHYTYLVEIQESEDLPYTIALDLNMDDEKKVTQATKDRYIRVLEQLIERAESKINWLD
jgi:hypothetical protein